MANLSRKDSGGVGSPRVSQVRRAIKAGTYPGSREDHELTDDQRKVQDVVLDEVVENLAKRELFGLN